MRSLLVVILPPAFDFAPCVTQTREPVRVQAFLSQAPVEALRIGVLNRLAGLDELQSYPAFFAPGRQGSAAKLRPVIQHNGFGQTSFAGNPIQHTSYTQSAQRSVDFNRRTFPRAIVHHRQHANHSSRAHAITHEIHRPLFVRPSRCRLPGRPTPADPPPLPNPHRQSFLAIQPIHTLVIYCRPFSYQHRAPASAPDTASWIVLASAACRRAARSSRTPLPHSSRLPEVPQALPVF